MTSGNLQTYGGKAYFAAAAEFSTERRRLGMLEQRGDPVTIARLRATGIVAGWRCLEVGAGAGSIAHWLADQVGADGAVVATDSDTRFLGDLAPRVQIRRHDILTDPIEDESYDLVHCRSLLMHLADPARAVERMAGALRPGGWLVMENWDYSSLRAVDCRDHYARGWDRAVVDVLTLAQSHGLFAADCGRHLPRLATRAGLTVRAQEGRTAVQRGGDFVAGFLAASMRNLTDVTARAGSQAALATILTGLDDSAFEFVDATNFGVSAQRAEDRTDRD